VTADEAAAKLRAALENMSAALLRDDLPAAETMAGALTAACAEATAAGVLLEPAERESITHLFRRCAEAANQRQEELRALLLQAGTSRRASDTYRSR
jgi:hypothetical protein